MVVVFHMLEEVLEEVFMLLPGRLPAGGLSQRTEVTQTAMVVAAEAEESLFIVTPIHVPVRSLPMVAPVLKTVLQEQSSPNCPVRLWGIC